MTLEQLILGISTSWDTACCLLIAGPPQPSNTHINTHTPSVAGATSPRPPPHVCVCVLKDTHCFYSMYNRYIREATGNCIKTPQKRWLLSGALAVMILLASFLSC